MKSAAIPNNQTDIHQPEFPFTRGARIGLLVLLLVTVLFAAGVLFITYQLDAFRAEVERNLESRIGAQLTMGDVSVNGVRGLRIDELRVEIALDQGPIVTLESPIALIDINLNNLLYGKIVVDRILLDNSHILLERPESAPWYTPAPPALEDTVPLTLDQEEPFRIVGSDCVLDVKNVVGDTALQISSFRFDVAQLLGSEEVRANLSGNLSGESSKHIDVKMNLVSMEDFDIKVQTELITAEDVNVVLPSPQHLVSGGQAHMTLWVNGRPNKTLLVSLQVPFEDIELRDQPEFLDPATGNLSVVATYSTETHALDVTMATAESDQLSGALDGSVVFGSEYPKFDLRLNATLDPVEELLDYLIGDSIDEYGELNLVLEEPHELLITLAGTSEAPLVEATASAGSGHLAFVPADETYPPMNFLLGKLSGTWNSETQQVSASCDVLDGEIYHEESRISAHSISGTITLDDNVLAMAPLNATITGNSFVGDVRYEVESGDAEIKLEGTLANIEDTILADSITHTILAGSVKVKGGAKKIGDRFLIDTEFDGTQAQIDYQWWFSKPIGIGTSGRLRAEIVPDESARFDAEGEIASSLILAHIDMGHTGGGDGEWFIRSLEATSDHLDINAVTTCAIIPYRITGGIGSAAHFSYARDPNDMNHVFQTVGCYLDEVTLLADTEGAELISGEGFAIELKMDTYLDRRAGSTGKISLKGNHVSVPPLGGPWFVPLEAPPGWPSRDRTWTYALAAESIDLLPWQGTQFSGSAYSNKSQNGFNSYKVQIEDGVLSGNYHAKRDENTYITEVEWQDVPAHYFLDHLDYPEALYGTVSGEIAYSIDRDDPSTIEGDGSFEVSDGQFSADFLYTLLQGDSDEPIATLPANLEFTALHADLEFFEDTVRTPTLTLESETIQVLGSGQFIREGDMDYNIELAIAPETAESIPILKENFALDGLRLSGQNLELAFHIGGPTFNPQGELAELPPASVTLVSGTLGLAKETISILDFPRKILMGVLKMGGGIVGSGTSN